jgi:hypothetical protein
MMELVFDKKEMEELRNYAMTEFDTNKNGALEKDEFLNFMVDVC